MNDTIGIGSTVWVFDLNYRVYRRGGGGGPIWRHHWRPRKIVRETSRSWVLEYGDKVPKKGASPRQFAFSETEIDQRTWVHEHRYRISQRVHQVSDYEQLRRIADLCGYAEAPE